MTRPSSARLLAPLAVAAILVLGACAGNKPKSACPAYGILSDASRGTWFRPGDGRDIVDVAYTAEVPKIDITCSGDEKKIHATVKLQVHVRPGAAMPAEGQVSVPFFVTLTRDDREIVAQQVYSSDFTFKPGEGGKAAIEEAEIDIPLGEGDRIAAYEVLVGLKLDRAQLDYNRSRRRPG